MEKRIQADTPLGFIAGALLLGFGLFGNGGPYWLLLLIGVGLVLAPLGLFHPLGRHRHGH
jgi:hypothetical protein